MSNEQESQRERYLGLWTSASADQEIGWDFKSDGQVSFYKDKQKQPEGDLPWSLQPDMSVVIVSPAGDFQVRFNTSNELEITPPKMLGDASSIFTKAQD